MTQPAMLILDRQPDPEPMFHVYRNGVFKGEMNREAMTALVSTFNANDTVMVYRLLREVEL